MDFGYCNGVMHNAITFLRHDDVKIEIRYTNSHFAEFISLL